uniref:ABC1 domain-containing protein n=1 Tax=Steinernema glaseri TaxID=37863 RepID=A0A1I8ALK4_9BILA
KTGELRFPMLIGLAAIFGLSAVYTCEPLCAEPRLTFRLVIVLTKSRLHFCRSLRDELVDGVAANVRFLRRSISVVSPLTAFDRAEEAAVESGRVMDLGILLRRVIPSSELGGDFDMQKDEVAALLM